LNIINIPAEKWYDAIQLRRSRRKFLSKPIDTQDIDHLKELCAILNSSIEGVRVVFTPEGPQPVLKGVIGSFGKIKGAPAYTTLIGDIKKPNVQEKVGYIGECFVLEATSMGLATCWVGGLFRPEVVKEQIHVKDNEEVLAILTVGYVGNEYGFAEKVIYGKTPKHKRKSLESLCEGLPQDEWPEWIRSALGAARLAPSAYNRQPWRFLVQKDSIKIYVDNSQNSSHITKRLDCGIAMLHLEIGVLYRGVWGKWEYLHSPDVARFMVW